MEHAPDHNPATRLIGGFVFLAAMGGLILQIWEPFTGTRLGYAGRILGPVSIALIGLHLFLQRRAHPLFSALVIVLSVASLVLVVAGFGR